MHLLTNVTFSELKTDNIIISQAKISYFMSASVYEPRVTDYVVYLNREAGTIMLTHALSQLTIPIKNRASTFTVSNYSI